MAGWRGLRAGDLSILQVPRTFPWCDRLWAVVGLLEALCDATYLSGGLGANFGVQVPSAGKFVQEKGDGTPGRFLNNCLASASPGPTLAWVRVGNRNTSGQPAPQFNVISTPLGKGFDIRTIWKN
jgi:hypothetical protein